MYKNKTKEQIERIRRIRAEQRKVRKKLWAELAHLNSLMEEDEDDYVQEEAE